VFGKREVFRTAFVGLDAGRVAAMTDRDVDRLAGEASIIRNRAKIQATIGNARAMMSASPSLAALARAGATDRTRAPRVLEDLPSATTLAHDLARRLKTQGYRFAGPTSVHAFMQNGAS
jgi:DNA-3-methyladenine glycosylase I